MEADLISVNRFWNYKKLGREYWSDEDNQLSFFRDIEQQFGIYHNSMDDKNNNHNNSNNQPSQWYNISQEEVDRRGGSHLLRLYYGGSLIQALTTFLYPKYDWQVWQFDQPTQESYWMIPMNVRNYMEKYPSIPVNSLEDWYRITPRDIIARVKKVGRIWMKCYNNSVCTMVRAVYPQYQWIESRFHERLEKDIGPEELPSQPEQQREVYIT